LRWKTELQIYRRLGRSSPMIGGLCFAGKNTSSSTIFWEIGGRRHGGGVHRWRNAAGLTTLGRGLCWNAAGISPHCNAKRFGTRETPISRAADPRLGSQIGPCFRARRGIDSPSYRGFMRTFQLLTLALLATAARADTVNLPIISAGYGCNDAGELSQSWFQLPMGWSISTRVQTAQLCESVPFYSPSVSPDVSLAWDGGQYTDLYLPWGTWGSDLGENSNLTEVRWQFDIQGPDVNIPNQPPPSELELTGPVTWTASVEFCVADPLSNDHCLTTSGYGNGGFLEDALITTDGIDIFNSMDYTLQAVPEPSTLLLLATVALALLLARTPFLRRRIGPFLHGERSARAAESDPDSAILSGDLGRDAACDGVSVGVRAGRACPATTTLRVRSPA